MSNLHYRVNLSKTKEIHHHKLNQHLIISELAKLGKNFFCVTQQFICIYNMESVLALARFI